MKFSKARGVVFAISVCVACACADNINGINMNFVPIDEAGGGVGYYYRIGQTEVSVSQFQDFITADGPDANFDVYGLSGQAPVVNITWHQAARYCNWLTSGNVTNGAYTIGAGGHVAAITPHSGSAMDALVSAYGQVYVMPTKDEWYKAAYYTGSGFSLYANGTSTLPVAEVDAVYNRAAPPSSTPWLVTDGTDEQNGTRNMMGNVWEWQESTAGGEAYDSGNNAQQMSFNGGDWFLGASFLASNKDAADDRGEALNIGLRIVAIPEPGTMSLMGLSTISLFATRGIRRRKRLGQSILPVRQDPLCDRFQTLEALESEQTMLEEATEVDVWLDTAKEHLLALGRHIQEGYRNIDKEIWNRLVAAHERRVIKRNALKTALKKRALGGFDAFLALFMK